MISKATKELNSLTAHGRKALLTLITQLGSREKAITAMALTLNRHAQVRGNQPHAGEICFAVQQWEDETIKQQAEHYDFITAPSEE